MNIAAANTAVAFQETVRAHLATLYPLLIDQPVTVRNGLVEKPDRAGLLVEFQPAADHDAIVEVAPPRLERQPRPVAGLHHAVGQHDGHLADALPDVAAMTEVWRTYWPKDPPTRTTIIAGPVEPDAPLQ